LEPQDGKASQVERDALIDEMDAQICMLGRLFSARHAEGGGRGTGHGHVGELSMPQYMLLHVLSQTGPMKMADIATMMGTKAPAVSSLVDAAERAGFVVREPDADDRRITRVGVTDAGRTALSDSESHRRDMMRRYVSVLPDEDLAALIRIQHILIEAMVAEKI
jgi:DNA-binding MarR family transcriptional regulator